MTKTDTPQAAFARASWAAARLGISVDTFRRRRPLLARAGFPEIDPIVGAYVKADVEAWISKRRQIDDAIPEDGEVNVDAL